MNTQEHQRKGYTRDADMVAWLSQTSDLPSTQHSHGAGNVAHWDLVALEKESKIRYETASLRSILMHKVLCIPTEQHGSL